MDEATATWPATVVDHDLRPGGRVTYVMTGPDGEKSSGSPSPPPTRCNRSSTWEEGLREAMGQIDGILAT